MENIPPFGDICIRKSNSILPPIVPTQSALPPIIPLEITISSVFLKMSSNSLNESKPSSRPNTPRNPSPVPVDFREKPVSTKGNLGISVRTPKPAFVIPQPSKFTPVEKSGPAGKNTTVVLESSTVGSDFTPVASIPRVSTEDTLDHPSHRTTSTNRKQTHDMLIESLYESQEAVDSATGSTGSNLVPHSVFRRTTPPNVNNYPAVPPKSVNRSLISNIPTSIGNESFRKQSMNYHPNMPRYSIDHSALKSPKVMLAKSWQKSILK